ncbi:response regulator transcription factor [Halorhabdus amylolytica]|uniref:response regulator transcription factor n=1 Tax=Halorhabdus amylolytica TaxID=2559573 RepID=UPI0010AB050D|nr:response regulator [Halorhabdus amylolytica]
MGESVTVAIVEDDPDVLELHRLRLLEEYDVVTIADGTEALHRIEDEDVLLLDRRLPGPDGDVVARRLRAEGYQGAIAMVTGERPEPAVADLPVDDYVIKPIDRSELRSLVDRLLTRLDAPEPVREWFAMVSRRGRLEDANDRMHLSDSSAYQSLVRRIDRQYRQIIGDAASHDRIAKMAGNTLDPTIGLPDPVDGPRRNARSIEATPGPGQEL